MCNPDSPWTYAVLDATTRLSDLYVHLQHTPVEHGLNALAALNRTFTGLHNEAQRAAITAARQQGWPLRRIAHALDCSHEQVRILVP